MLAQGLKGKSLVELQSALGYGGEGNILEGHAKRCLDGLHSAKKTEGVTIKITNSIYTSQQVAIKQGYVDQVAKIHHAIAKSVNFGTP